MFTSERRKKMAQRLRSLREAKGISSPSELSAALKAKYGDNINASTETLKSWETTKEGSQRFNKGYGARADTLCMLADFFNVSVSYLLSEPGAVEHQNLGFSDLAIVNLTDHPPYNMVFPLPDNMVKTQTHIRRDVVDGIPGTKIEETMLTIDPDLSGVMDKIPKLYLKTLNEILEKQPSILTTIATILYADEGISRSDPIDHFTVDGFAFYPPAPGGNPTINGHLDELSNQILNLRQMIQEEGKEK